MQHLLLTIICGLALFLHVEASTSWSATLNRPLSRALASASTSTKIPIIITLNNQVAPAKFNSLSAGKTRRDALIKALHKQADDSQRELRLFLKASGVSQHKLLWATNSLAVLAPSELIPTLAARPEVAEIRLDGIISAPAPTPSAVAGSERNISAVGAPTLWKLGLTGSGVVVASLDTGVDALHPDLAGSYRGGTGAWLDPYNEHAAPYDKNGHGTAVMGTMVGGAAGGTGIGMAPGAKWIAAKIFNDADIASYSAIHQAFAWALDPDGNGDSTDAPQVLNNSWDLGTPNLCLPEFQPDIQLLKQAGVAVVFSAGNTGPNPTSSTSPANYPESMSVGSVDNSGNIASYSGRGPSCCAGGDQLFPKLVAPGINIKSADLTLSGANPDPYAYYDGTSFSAPLVSGLIALLLGQNGSPTASLNDLEAALQGGADDLGSLGPDQTYGHGLINGLASYRRLHGQPHLAVYDPRPPEQDLRLDFGSIPVGAELTRSLTLRNSGGGGLVFPGHDWSGLPSAMTVTEDFCSGLSLVSDQTCRISVRFAPTAPVAYAADLNLRSNDQDFPLLPISLNGSGNNDPTPPALRVEPAGLILEFGSVPPGVSSQRAMTLRNSGMAILTIGSVDFSAVGAPFSQVSDVCSNISLAQNESCTVQVAFAPEQLQTYRTQLSFTTNDPQHSQTTVTITGTGNHPPTSATLISPADGETGLSTSLTFHWMPGSDLDGDQVSYRVELSPVASAGVAGLLWPSATILGLMAMSGTLLFLPRRRLLVPVLFAFSSTLLFLASCGGGGGTASDASNSYQVSGLYPRTTYSWKVIATDSRGAETESATWHFTTR